MDRVKRPKWHVEISIRVGLAAYMLALQFRSKIEGRLPAGLIDGLYADVETLKGTKTEASVARSRKKSSTESKHDAAHEGVNLVLAIRKAVRDAQPEDLALHKAYGVGVRVSVKKVAGIESGLQTILDAAQKDPAGARAVGILPEDLAEAQRLKDLLGAAGETQVGKQVSAKEATSDRNSAQLRVEAAVGRIIGAGTLALRDDPATVKLFTELTPGHVGLDPEEDKARKEKRAASEAEEAKKKGEEAAKDKEHEKAEGKPASAEPPKQK